MKNLFIATIICAFSLSSCDVVQQVSSSLNMVNCKYEYNSISNLSLAGINVSEGLSMVNIAKASSLLMGDTSSLPVEMTLNLNVTNPNVTDALMNGLQYILTIDGVDFTTGSVAKQFSVPAGKTNVLPLSLGFDVAKLLTGETKDAATNAVKNLIGIGGDKSSVTLKIKPSFLVNNYTVTSPVYIPIEFSFGGR